MMTFHEATAKALDALHGAMTPTAEVAAILRTEADRDGNHEQIANMLRVCADALAMHPTPRELCLRNYERLCASLAGDASRWPAGLTATDVRLAADAFFVAAGLLK